ncbi:MAG TPA: malic enzyme-like NAD(P)-binding protein, partial [Bacillota bacterium]
PSSLRIVINGAGAAGTAVAMMLHTLGFRRLLVCDSRGVLAPGRPEGMTPRKERLARQTNPEGVRGQLPDVLPGADIFVGLSTAGALRPEWVRSMAAEPVIMALANPEPEIDPEAARSAGARIVCTARSDHPNQINNALAFPGLLRGALDARARRMTPRMFESAARALAGVLSAGEMTEESILPNLWDPRVVPAVAAAVAEAAAADGVAPVTCAPGPGSPGPR